MSAVTGTSPGVAWEPADALGPAGGGKGGGAHGQGRLGTSKTSQVSHLPKNPLWESFWKWKTKQSTPLFKTLQWLPVSYSMKNRLLNEAPKVLHVLTSSPTVSQCTYTSVSFRVETSWRQDLCPVVLCSQNRAAIYLGVWWTYSNNEDIPEVWVIVHSKNLYNLSHQGSPLFPKKRPILLSSGSPDGNGPSPLQF